MKKNFRGMTLAALLLSASTSAAADTNEYVASHPSSQAFVGDMTAGESVHVGNYPSNPAHSSPTRARPVQPIRNFAPVSVGDLQPAGFFDGGYVGSATSCDACDSPGCDGIGCDSMHGRKRNGLHNLLNLCDKDGWIRAEGLLMFHANRSAPPLVTSSTGNDFPILPDATVEFGDELDGGLSGGFRADVGRYFGDHFGIGGRITWVSENGDTYSASGDQNNPNDLNLGRPYFYVPLSVPDVGGEDSEIVNQFGLFSGTVDAEFATDLLMAEAYGRFTLCRNKASRLEMIGGYTYGRLDDMLRITSTTTDLTDGTLPSTTFSSLFDAENTFHGGQIGFDTLVSRGRWSARALTKVHLGNMRQEVLIQGSTIDALGGQVASMQNSSLLVGEDQGLESQDVFTFIPQMDFTLGYRFRDHVSFTAGYTFMYFDNVALAGEQVNRYRDTSNLGDDVTPVGFDIVEGNHWVQGISLGASVDY